MTSNIHSASIYAGWLIQYGQTKAFTVRIVRDQIQHKSLGGAAESSVQFVDHTRGVFSNSGITAFYQTSNVHRESIHLTLDWNCSWKWVEMNNINNSSIQQSINPIFVCNHSKIKIYINRNTTVNVVWAATPVSALQPDFLLIPTESAEFLTMYFRITWINALFYS